MIDEMPRIKEWLCVGISHCAGVPVALFLTGIEYEPNWPNILLENNFTIGDIMGVAINLAGNIILLHRGTYRFKDADFR